MDFPNAIRHKPVISSISREAIGDILMAENPAGIAGGAWPAANRAIFVPFALSSPYLVRKVWWANGATVAGNVDVGVLTPGGALLLNAGTTAMAGVTTIQSVTLGTPVLLSPGQYYMAMEASSTSTSFGRNALTADFCSMAGMAQQAVGSMPLPAAAVLATIAAAYVPLFGIASAGVI